MQRDVLSGFYSRDAGAVRTALQRLTSPDEPARGRVVANADVPYTARARIPADGLWSQAFFGPRDARDPRAWAVIELPVPLFHRAMTGLVAERLGLRDVEVVAIVERRAWLEDGKAKFPPGHPGADSPLAIAIDGWPPDPEDAGAQAIDADALGRADEGWLERAEAATGLDALVEALGSADLVVERVPVPPITDRPLEPRRGGYLGAGAKSRALAELLFFTQRTRRLIELAAPAVIVASERQAMQHALDALLDRFIGDAVDAPETREGPEPAAPPPTTLGWHVPDEVEELVTVVGLAFSGPTRALVDFATATFEVDLASGEILARFRSGGLRLAAVGGALAVYGNADTWQFSVRDLSSGQWQTGPLSDALPFAFGELHERAYVVDLTTGAVHPLRELGDYPTHLVLAPTRDAFYATDKEGLGGVYRYDGELEFPIEQGIGYECARVLRSDGRLEEVSEETLFDLQDELSEELAAFAFSETKQRWRVVREGCLFDGLDPAFRFGGRIAAAAFDANAENLLVVVGSEILFVGLDPEIRVRAAYDLAPLRAAFLGPEAIASALPTTALHAVLFRHGTLADAAGESAAALAALEMASADDEPQPLGLESAEVVRALAARVELPTKLPAISAS